MILSFSKFQGAGNDFILVDDRSNVFPCSPAKVVRTLCHRRFGIGADGLILLQSSAKADFRMRIFNSDGNEPSMCGNGIRCLLQFIRSLGFREDAYRIETMHSVLLCRFIGERISVAMGKPQVLHWGIKVPLCGGEETMYVVHTGVPHAVLFVEDLENAEVFKKGKEIRHHPAFAPEGVNVNFAKLGDSGNVLIRTYERGVEDETLACGTGAAASAVAAMELYALGCPIRVKTASGDEIEVNITESVSGGKEIEILGKATFVYEGQIEI